MEYGKTARGAISQRNGKYVITEKLSMRGLWKVNLNVKMLDGRDEAKDFTVDAK